MCGGRYGQEGNEEGEGRGEGKGRMKTIQHSSYFSPVLSSIQGAMNKIFKLHFWHYNLKLLHCWRYCNP